MIILIRSSFMLIIITLLFIACSSRLEDLANERNRLAQSEDILAKCRLFVLQDDFKEKQELCTVFSKKDAECSLFLEEKEDCIQFIHKPNYSSKKLICREFGRQVYDCKKQVETEIFSWFDILSEQIGLSNIQDDWIQKLSTFKPKIHLGIIWSGGNDKSVSFLRGVKFATREINQQGGVLGRKLKLHIKADHADADKSRKVAESISENINIRAVVGLQRSVSTIPVTYTYEGSNIVYLAISATNDQVVRYGMRFIFRQLPNNSSFAKALVGFCLKNDYKNVVLLYSRDIYSEELSYALRDYIVKNNLKIVFEKSFFDGKGNFLEVATDIKETQVDAVFLVTTSIPTAKQVINSLRSMGITTPLIGVESLDSNEFIAAVGIQGNGFVIPTIYNPFSEHTENVTFIKTFKDYYGFSPDTWTAQGYDAIKLLAYVMNDVRSTVPANIAAGLRYMQPHIGVTGKYAYKTSGELVEKEIYFKELKYEEFILFKDVKAEEIQQKIKITNDKIILRPEKPSEASEAVSAF